VAKKKTKINLHCAVIGCRTKQPHLSNPTTAGIHAAFTKPEQLAAWVKASLVEIVQSVIDDVNNHRYFAYLTRFRQPEEMYYRALYVLFVAQPPEITHIMSNEVPNSFSAMWKAVNAKVYAGKGSLDRQQVGLGSEPFTAMDTLNSGAHASLGAVVTVIDLSRNRVKWQPIIAKHINYWKSLCDNLDWIEQKFKAGDSATDILIGFQKHIGIL
jgi:hypothetical protein